MNVVDHPGLGKDTRNGIGGGAVERHPVVESRAGDAGAFSLFREAVNIQGSGAEIVHIRDDRNIHVRGDHAVILNDLGHRDDRLVRQREQFLVGGATADEHAFESVNFDQTSRQDIVSVGADQRLRAIHQCAKAGAHGSRRRLRRSSRRRGQRTGSRHQSRCRQPGCLDKLASIGCSGHDRLPKLAVIRLIRHFSDVISGPWR